MKFTNALLSLALLQAVPPLSAPAQKAGSDYPLSAHVSATRFAYLCNEVTGGTSFCLGPQQLTVQIAAKKYELAGGDYKHGGSRKGLLPLGNYRAKIFKEEHQPSSEFQLIFEFLLPDNSTQRFAVIGETE